MLIIDFESSGEANSFYGIPCEVSILHIVDGKIEDFYYSLINVSDYIKRPFKSSLKKSAKFHGITYKEIERDGKNIQEVAREVEEYINKYYDEYNCKLYAWSTGFEEIFLSKLFMFGEMEDSLKKAYSYKWVEMMPIYKKGLDRYMDEENLEYTEMIIEKNPIIKEMWNKQARHRAFYDTVFEYAMMTKYKKKF